MTTFSAAHDPWLPVMTAAGERLMSLRDALVQAHAVLELATGDPLADVALTRLLVALVLRTHTTKDTDSLAGLLEAGQLDAEAIDSYFAEYADRFDVFGNHPWMQVRDLTTGKAPQSTNGLRLEAPTGNNVPLYAKALDLHASPMTVPEAMRRMLVIQCFDTSGTKPAMVGDQRAVNGLVYGSSAGILADMGVVLLQGRTLLETLVLNTPTETPDDGHDTPSWEHDVAVTGDTRPAHGPMDLFTWQARRIRLILGDGGLVTGAYIGSGDRLSIRNPAMEPHTRWKAVTGEEVTQRPVRWQPGRAAWRGLDSLVALQPTGDKITAPLTVRQLADLENVLGIDYPLRVLCVGIEYNNAQKGAITDLIVDQLPLPLAALLVDENRSVAAAIGELSSVAEGLRRALNDLDSNVRRAQGGDKLEWDKGRHPGDETMGQLALPTHRLLVALQAEPARVTERMAAWRTEVRRIVLAVADTICDNANPVAFGGRDITLADAESRFRKSLNEHLPPTPPPSTIDTQELLDENKESR